MLIELTVYKQDIDRRVIMFKYKLQFLNENISEKFAQSAIDYELKRIGSAVIISGRYEDEFDIINHICRYQGYFVSLTEQEKQMVL